MLFPILKSEDVLQIGDKVRLSATETFKTPDEPSITKVEFETEEMAGFINVYNVDPSLWYLDWVYTTDGTKEVTLKVTTSTGGMTPTIEEYTITKEITVLDSDDDYLFSNDADLRTREHDIEKWIPEGYSNWNHIHRQAQRNILDWLDEIRVLKTDGTRWTAKDIVTKEQVRRLSSLIALRMIYGSISNQVDDVFAEKYELYLSREREARNRSYISLDFNGDGNITANEKQDLRTTTILRR